MRRSPSSPPHLQLASASTLAPSSSQQDPSSHQETTQHVGHQHDLSEHLLDSSSLGYCPPESSSPPGKHSTLPGDLVSSRGRCPSVAFLTRTAQYSQLPKASVHIGKLAILGSTGQEGNTGT